MIEKALKIEGWMIEQELLWLSKTVQSNTNKINFIKLTRIYNKIQHYDK